MTVPDRMSVNIWKVFANTAYGTYIYMFAGTEFRYLSVLTITASKMIFMPPKELWEAYSNRTVRPSVRPAFVSGPYLLYSLR